MMALESWARGEVQVMVCTSAFGMGFRPAWCWQGDPNRCPTQPWAVCSRVWTSWERQSPMSRDHLFPWEWSAACQVLVWRREPWSAASDTHRVSSIVEVHVQDNYVFTWKISCYSTYVYSMIESQLELKVFPLNMCTCTCIYPLHLGTCRFVYSHVAGRCWRRDIGPLWRLR